MHAKIVKQESPQSFRFKQKYVKMVCFAKFAELRTKGFNSDELGAFAFLR